MRSAAEPIAFSFFGFFFAVLVASFRWGFKEGLSVTSVSIFSFVLVSWIAHPYGVELEHNRFLLRCISFLIMGYMMAYWGEFEITLRRRMELLKEITRLSSTRFGIDYVLSALLEQLRDYYDADTCMLVVGYKEKPIFTIRKANRQKNETFVREEPLDPDLAHKVLVFPANCSVVYGSEPRLWKHHLYSCYTYDTTSNKLTTENHPKYETVATLFETKSYLTVPLNHQLLAEGRLFLFSPHRFNLSEMHFLFQAMIQLLPVLENIRLVDRMASDAAEIERHRIALDIHDSVIQPYIGLKIGLTAIQRKANAGDGAVAQDIETLLELTESGINDLRQYISSLRSASVAGEGLNLSIKRFTAKFAEATGISVQVQLADEIRLNDRLAAEIFQMVAEGLSNIRKHTLARRVTIIIEYKTNLLTLKIENERERESAWAAFTPHSIADRAEFLGGKTEVKQGKEGNTIVFVEVPL